MFIGICSRSQVSVYRTIGPLVYFVTVTEASLDCGEVVKALPCKNESWVRSQDSPFLLTNFKSRSSLTLAVEWDIKHEIIQPT